MKNLNLQNWFYWGLGNLAIVALYGMAMRYKIAFDFPFLQQKNLLHAHSHFAFNGWISQVLYAGLMLVIFPFLTEGKRRKYHLLMVANLIASFGMLFAFTVGGYNVVSISFSTLSIVIAVIYAVFFIKDQKFLPANHPSKKWAITGLLLNVLSALGPFSLAYMMATKHIDPNFYLGSIYYYLHFQYNGWFFFGSMAIAVAYVPATFKSLNKYFWAFAIAVIPTFFLSILWAKLPLSVYVIAVAATFLQLFAWLALLYALVKFYKKHHSEFSLGWAKWLFMLAVIALTVKFVLQAVSVIPSLSQLVFGFRPIVIAYLHLVLLGIYTFFLIGFLFAKKIIQPSKKVKMFTFIFAFGVLCNELFLGIQGVGAFFYFSIPFINILLFGAAIALLIGATGIALTSIWSRRTVKVEA